MTLAERMLSALRALTEECVHHPCGGVRNDDMEWRMGTAFTGQEALWAALDELQAARLIRYAGYDDADAIGHCYELTEQANLGRRIGDCQGMGNGTGSGTGHETHPSVG